MRVYIKIAIPFLNYLNMLEYFAKQCLASLHFTQIFNKQLHIGADTLLHDTAQHIGNHNVNILVMRTAHGQHERLKIARQVSDTLLGAEAIEALHG